MGDYHHRHALVTQVAHDLQHAAHELGIERRGRLVEQHQLGLQCERARDGDPLLLAAGELTRIGVGLLDESHVFQHAASALLGVLAAHPEHFA